MTTTPRQTIAALELVKLVCRALDEKKADNLQVLDVSAQSSITDYLVLATGTSEPHLRALRIEMEKVLDASQVHIVGVDTQQGSGWLVVDAFDVMVHLFTVQMREHYRLETLWKDAVEVSVPRLLAPPKPESRRKAAPAAKAPRATAAKARTKVSAKASKPKAPKKGAPAKKKARSAKR